MQATDQDPALIWHAIQQNSAIPTIEDSPASATISTGGTVNSFFADHNNQISNQPNITIRLTDNAAAASSSTPPIEQHNNSGHATRSRGNPPKNFSSVTETRAMLENNQCYTRFRMVNPDKPSSSRQSDVWKLFEEIISKETNEFTGMIRCHNCLFITRYHGQTTGTSHMRRHRCFGELFPNSVKDAAKRHELRIQMASANTSLDGEIKIDDDSDDRPYSQSSTTNKRKQEEVEIEEYGTIPDSVLSPYYEVKDIVTTQFVNYCMCKSCFHFVPYNLAALEKHECKRPSKNDLLAAIGTQPKNGDLIFRHKPNIRSASDIWLNFQEIVDPTTNIILGWVRCVLCTAIIRASDRKAMPKTLRTHMVSCSKYDGNKSMLLKDNSHLGMDASTSSADGLYTVSKADIKNRQYAAKVGQANLALNGNDSKFGYSGDMRFNSRANAKSLTPLKPTSASRNDYRNLALQLLKNAALQQPKVTNPIVLNLQSLQLQTQTLYEHEKSMILKEINSCIEHNLGGTIVSDFKEDLCIMSLCYIDRNWKLQDRVLRGSSRISDFLQFISTTLKDYGLLEDTLINKFSYISNAGQLSGVKVHLSSASHLLDNCVDVAIFNDGRYDQLIQNCKHICSELKLLPDSSSVDWMYKYDLIKTVMDNVDKFIPGNFSMDSMLQTMTTIKDLLSPLKEASLLMRSNVHQTPSINQVALQYFRLRKFLGAEDPEDSEVMTQQKQDLLAEIDNSIKLHMWHKLAVFFWPNFRHLKMFTETERREIHEEVRKLMEVHSCHVEESEEFKATVTARSQYAEWEALTEFDQDELNRYISDKSNYCNEKSLLTWWQEASKRYPKLAHIARSVLCVPASVTSIERRERLHDRPPVDEKLIFLHCNLAAR